MIRGLTAQLVFYYPNSIGRGKKALGKSLLPLKIKIPGGLYRMKAWLRIPFTLFPFFFLSFFIWTPSLWSQEPKQAEITPREIEKTIQLLENPEESKKLAAQLKSLLEAQKQLGQREKAAEVKQEEEVIPDLFELYEVYQTQAFTVVKDFFSMVSDLPRLFSRFKESLAKKENLRRLRSVGIRLAIAFLAGFLTWLILRGYIRRWTQRITLQRPSTQFQKIRNVFIETFFQIYPWIAIYVYAYLFLILFPMGKNAQTLLLRSLLALILYFVAKNIAYFLLSPESPEKRVLPLPDQLSGYIFIWARRILLFSLWMYLFYLPTGAPRWSSIAIALGTVYKFVLIIMAGIILAQWKERIQQLLTFSLQEGEPTWKSSLKRIFNFLSGKIYLFALSYLGLLVVFSLTASPATYAFLLAATGKSLLIILLAIGLWILWGLGFAKIFQVSKNLKEKYPDLEEQVNRYVHYLGKAGYLAILVFAALSLVEVWGVDIFALMGANASWIKAILRIPFIILFSAIFIQVANFLIDKFAHHMKIRILASSVSPPIEIEKRVSTLSRIFKRAILVIVATFATIMSLSELGFDIKPILAGAGIVGLAVGFGAQNLVRDILSGLFFIFENRIRAGDVAIINGTGGVVEQVNLRTTVLRGLDGTVHVFPNGAINTLSNMTYEYSYYLFNVGVAYKEDTDRVVAVLKEISKEILQEEEFKSAILEPIEILGVDEFADSAVVIKARIKTLPIKQWFVGREMNRRIKKRFDELGIEIPFPHRSLYFGEASKSISVKLEGFQEKKEEIKTIIREVLKESK